MTDIERRAESTHFIIATNEYAEAIRRGRQKILDEISLAKLTHIPTIVVWLDLITRADEETIRKALLDVSIVFETRCVNTDESMEMSIQSIKEFLSQQS